MEILFFPVFVFLCMMAFIAPFVICAWVMSR